MSILRFVFWLFVVCLHLVKLLMSVDVLFSFGIVVDLFFAYTFFCSGVITSDLIQSPATSTYQLDYYFSRLKRRCRLSHAYNFLSCPKGCSMRMHSFGFGCQPLANSDCLFSRADYSRVTRLTPIRKSARQQLASVTELPTRDPWLPNGTNQLRIDASYEIVPMPSFTNVMECFSVSLSIAFLSVLSILVDGLYCIRMVCTKFNLEPVLEGMISSEGTTSSPCTFPAVLPLFEGHSMASKKIVMFVPQSRLHLHPRHLNFVDVYVRKPTNPYLCYVSQDIGYISLLHGGHPVYHEASFEEYVLFRGLSGDVMLGEYRTFAARNLSSGGRIACTLTATMDAVVL